MNAIELVERAIETFVRDPMIGCQHLEGRPAGWLCLLHPGAGVMCRSCCAHHRQRHVEQCAHCGTTDRPLVTEKVGMPAFVRATVEINTTDGHLCTVPRVLMLVILCGSCQQGLTP